jgi:hypothetical protein
MTVPLAPAKFQAGTVVRFTYNHRAKDEQTGPRYKEVFVLHPNWLGQMHGIDLGRLTAAEREVLFAVFDPRNKGKNHRIILVNDILRRMDPLVEVKNPQSFYYKFVKVFLKNKDAYRRYDLPMVSGASVVKKALAPAGPGVFNPKPLFKKIESKPSSTPFKSTTPAQSIHGKVKSGEDLKALVAKQMGVGLAKPGQAKAPLTQQQRMANLKKAQAKLKR